MTYRRLHPWNVGIARAARIQRSLRGRLRLAPPRSGAPLALIAGADVSYDRGSDVLYGAVVVLTFPDLAVVETAGSVGIARFPYVPGYLSFREIPILLRAFRKIRRRPDLIVCDGQGIAHPRGSSRARPRARVEGGPRARREDRRNGPSIARRRRAALRLAGAQDRRRERRARRPRVLPRRADPGADAPGAHGGQPASETARPRRRVSGAWRSAATDTPARSRGRRRRGSGWSPSRSNRAACRPPTCSRR